jgi:hypothetical protein
MPAPRSPRRIRTAGGDDREHSLAVPAPPSLTAAARAAACPPAGVQALERSGRIVVLEPDLAYASSTYRELAARATAMAGTAPLTPAAYRDATGTSRKFVMAILEDLDRRGILRRTDAGHVPGPRAATARPARHDRHGDGRDDVLAGGRSSRFGRTSRRARRRRPLSRPRDRCRPTRDDRGPRRRRARFRAGGPGRCSSCTTPRRSRARSPAWPPVSRRPAQTSCVLAGDMPAIVPGVLERLVAAMTAAGADAAVLGSATIGRRSRWRCAGQRR